MKTLVVEIADSTKAKLVENVELRHLSDLAGEVKEAIDDFVQFNEGAVIPPVSIRINEKVAPTERDRRDGEEDQGRP
jgi:hypothetical protein